LLLSPAARRPFDFESVALDIRHVDVGFRSKGRHHLAAALTDVAERKSGLREVDAELLAEFPARHLFGIFVSAVFALWNRPRGQILVAPERPAGMDQQHLDHSVAFAERKDAGAS
jgi:hypothetical protein